MKLMVESGLSDLELIDDSGQMMNVAEMPLIEKAYTLLKDGNTYYPVIIRKNTDGSLGSFDIYGKEVRLIVNRFCGFTNIGC